MVSTVAPASTTVVLRKRKRGAASLVLRVPSSPSPSYRSQSESEFEPVPQISSSSSASLHAKQIKKIRNKSYQCTHEGCGKAYSKPSRLAEHERSHTGDRPFICHVCKNTYLRDSHLQAHARTHQPDSAKPLVCDEPGCEKRFWTSQHLRVHQQLHKGEKPFKCTEPTCQASFGKHHQLREHVCTNHALQGTKPYRCEHPECTKSFLTNQKLRAHAKTHTEKRYTCVHESCLPAPGSAPTYFQTWSTLQHHMRASHPPTCPYPSCNGKAFAAQKGLRAHLKLHSERDLEAELAAAETLPSEDGETPKKRRRGGEVGRDWICAEEGCGKDFKSKKALTSHHNVSHLGRRDFICPHADCRRAFGYKHLLQRHVAKIHRAKSPSSSESDTQTDQESDGDTALSIDFITGHAYQTRSQTRFKNPANLQCPYPTLPPSFVLNEVPTSASGQSGGCCRFVFSRAYDLRRHLQSEHGLVVEKGSVDEWVRNLKHDRLSEMPLLVRS
ncbi:uncharacterized protein LAESUDRAFT_743186 [Laetiporus sulphureus 93-53]|uniref:C2H2-type domain-containing protein n=1 Tax=Laetiporus sulphureus 93-53 TaxID=1314785 RepID=A0A165EEA2_9APHY|nr:uncharacterized protein LAESUDRAFT_743186 [Laetiporus sulphureus 93-53]KZT06855.1 hypothetical protein LAESUDRAFT_743186 [Laetiporus sulphureus 93-53]